jgi:hypothetical protein
MAKHIANECTKAPANVKLKQLEFLASKSGVEEVEEEDKQGVKRIKTTGGMQKKILYHIDNSAVTAGQKKILDFKMTMFFIMCNIPFRAASSPWFLDFTQALKPNYVPAGMFLASFGVPSQEAISYCRLSCSSLIICVLIILTLD